MNCFYSPLSPGAHTFDQTPLMGFKEGPKMAKNSFFKDRTFYDFFLSEHFLLGSLILKWFQIRQALSLLFIKLLL